MSKTAARMKMMKNVVEKLDHSSPMRTNIPAGMASPAPPLGSQLSTRSINIPAFIKEFNERTAEMKKGIPIPVRVTLNPDRTHNLIMLNPTNTYYLKQAAGVQRGAMQPGREVAGKITIKHIYEIAQIKSQDPPLRGKPLREICILVLRSAKSLGIQVQKELDPEEYKTFLEERKLVEDAQNQELLEKKEAKMLRMS